MIFNKLILLIGVFFLLNSCKKPEESELWTEVSVSATNHVTGDALSDIYISIVQTKNKTLFDSESEVISEGWTDENGDYYFGWKAKGNSKYSYEYIAQADAGKYHQINFQQFAYLDKGAEHNFNLSLVPYGELKLKFVNISCFDEYDKFIFYQENLDIEDGYYLQNGWQFDGCINFTQSDYSSDPMGNIHFEWHVTKNNITEIFHDTIFLDQGESILYEVNY